MVSFTNESFKPKTKVKLLAKDLLIQGLELIYFSNLKYFDNFTNENSCLILAMLLNKILILTTFFLTVKVTINTWPTESLKTQESTRKKLKSQ